MANDDFHLHLPARASSPEPEQQVPRRRRRRNNAEELAVADGLLCLQEVSLALFVSSIYAVGALDRLQMQSSGNNHNKHKEKNGKYEENTDSVLFMQYMVTA